MLPLGVLLSLDLRRFTADSMQGNSTRHGCLHPIIPPTRQWPREKAGEGHPVWTRRKHLFGFTASRLGTTEQKATWCRKQRTRICHKGKPSISHLQATAIQGSVENSRPDWAEKRRGWPCWAPVTNEMQAWGVESIDGRRRAQGKAASARPLACRGRPALGKAPRLPDPSSPLVPRL